MSRRKAFGTMANVGIWSDFKPDINAKATREAFEAYEKRKGIGRIEPARMSRIKSIFRKLKAGTLSAATAAAVTREHGRLFRKWEKTGVPA